MASVYFHVATGTQNYRTRKILNSMEVGNGPVKSTQTYEKARNWLQFRSNFRSGRCVRSRLQFKTEEKWRSRLRAKN